MESEVLIEKWPLPNPLRIMGWTYSEIELVATIMRDAEFEACSEAAEINYLGETLANRSRYRIAARGLLAQG